MTWTHYRLVFQLKSPLHIGWRKVGNLMQTRRYVPGKVLWGALTARIVQMAGWGSDSNAYRQVGEALKQCFRFGYLWPAQGQKNNSGQWSPHFPWQKESKAYYWDYLYLNGMARTALTASERIASEGMLHQIEYIMPFTREGAPVYLIGDLWVRENLEECSNDAFRYVQNWEEALNSLQLGGERGYGWGRVCLICLEPDDKSTTTITWGDGWKWTSEKAGSDEHVILEWKEKNRDEGYLPVHALAADFSAPNEEEKEGAVSEIEGLIEPWVGWEYTSKGFQVSRARILYQPGAKLRSNFQGILHPWGYLYSLNKGSIHPISALKRG
ncbi:MAG: hypothetical protein J7L69_00485 [Desulfobulbaceae bacterium]|nr:hypothetical protein [Desulfobulbaceae bacterium]